MGKADRKLMQEQMRLVAMTEGFLPCSVLFGLLKLGVFKRCGTGEQRLDELAAEVGAPTERLVRLLNAGVMLELLETTPEGGFRVPERLHPLLLPTAGQSYLGDWVQLQAEFAIGFADLDRVVLDGRPPIEPSVYLGADQTRTRRYVLAMHNYATLRGRELAHYLDLGECRTLLDLGCGAGTYARLLAEGRPEMELYLADMPGVLEVAREIQSQDPLPNPIHYIPCDAGHDPITGQYDLIIASNMLHCFDDVTRTRLLEQLFAATHPGGSLVVQAQHLQENHQGNRWAIFVDLALLCTTDSGRNHSMSETRRWLTDTGYESIEECGMSVYGANSFVRGYRPQNGSPDPGP